MIELMAVSQDGSIIATSANDCKINLIDTNTQKLLHCFDQFKPG